MEKGKYQLGPKHFYLLEIQYFVIEALRLRGETFSQF